MEPKYALYLFLSLLIGCKNNQEKVILTSGRSMNPNEPRFGIELSETNLYYCEEIMTKRGTYKYYQGQMNSIIFLKIKTDLNKLFQEKILLDKIIDGTPYDLYFDFEERIYNTRFYYFFLNDNQSELIQKIENFKKNKLTEIKYHFFPQELLTQNLPKPPL